MTEDELARLKSVGVELERLFAKRPDEGPFAADFDEWLLQLGEFTAANRAVVLAALRVTPVADTAGIELWQRMDAEWRRLRRLEAAGTMEAVPMNELAETFRPLLSWAEAVSQHHAMLRTEPPFTSTKKLKDALASAYAALRVTPVADTAGIDAAWREAEAALPEGWSMGSLIAGVSFGPGFLVRTTQWRATAYSLDLKRKPEGMGPTPAAALLALAVALRTPKSEGEPEMSFIESFQRDHPSEPEK